MVTPGPTRRGDVVLVRHGETDWSISGQHTGITDIPLTEHGRDEARRLRPLLSGSDYVLVLSSPLERARTTCELAGLGQRMRIDPDLLEWNYGAYEGLTPAEIERTAPGWMNRATGPVSADPADDPIHPGADLLRAFPPGHPSVKTHGHVFRVFTARWIGFPPGEGRHFMLDTSTLSVLSYYHGTPALKRWNAAITPRR